MMETPVQKISAELIKPLPFKEIEMDEWWGESPERLGYWENRKRLLFFDPKQVYENIGEKLNPYRRKQGGLSTAILFPKRTDGFCRCGCGNKSESMWHSTNCSNFAYKVYSIICYGTADIKNLITTYYGDKCFNCDNNWDDIDHVVPVKHGGGGCWISNFMPLCKSCHKIKTKKDFNWAEFKQPVVIKEQIKLDI